MQKANAGSNSTNIRMRSTDRNRNTLQKLKQSLRMTIMAKRHARGEDEIKVELSQPETQEVNNEFLCFD
jgi:hypothetical protein